ncbi:hypothetical protein SAMN05720591_11546 [Halolactibacillus alkaliphilus]|nr:hypothetical protein SAMN05720591_11546 [Halolactibacillus alkaliphilus]
MGLMMEQGLTIVDERNQELILIFICSEIYRCIVAKHAKFRRLLGSFHHVYYKYLTDRRSDKIPNVLSDLNYTDFIL